MTYRSFWIEALDEGQSEPEIPTYATRARNIAKLDRFADKCSVRTLTDWASSQGASARYIDNCWVRVEVSVGQLFEFLTEIADIPESTLETLRTRTSDAYRCVMVAEEF